MAETNHGPLRVFWSYSHKDEELREKLDTHLSALKRERRIEVWHDRKIPPGANWRADIDRELDSANIILLLVSANFLNSEFCHAVELRRAIERHKRGDALVIPIMLRPCDVEGTVIESLQQLPDGGKPITKWGNRDEACQDVARRLRIAVEEWNSPTPTARSRVSAGPAAAKDDEQQASVLTRIFGFGQSVNLGWLKMVLERGAAVARIKSKKDGEGFGTGFLVDPSSFGFEHSNAPVLLSASFVIDPTAGSPVPKSPHGLRPDDVIAEFQIAGVERCLRTVLWSSPVGELRSVLVSLDGPVEAQPIPLTPKPRDWHEGPHSRVVVIGHPYGNDLQFSIQDTLVLDSDETRLHYRAATAPGSSGSPVLSADLLQVLAIHTAKLHNMPRLRGEGTYEACEGTSLHAIQSATRRLKT